MLEIEQGPHQNTRFSREKKQKALISPETVLYASQGKVTEKTKSEKQVKKM